MVDELPEHPTVADLLGEMDAEGAPPPPLSEPIKPVPLMRRLVPKPGQAPVAPLPTAAPQVQQADISSLSYPEWLRAYESKYRALLRVRSADDFIDIDLLNTVMADYGGTYAEVAREAREYQDSAEDAQERFDLWWDVKVDEARTRAATESKKITSDSGLQTYARACFSAEYAERHEAVKMAKRKAEFLGTLKMVVQTTATVLRSLTSSVAFEWSTAGGLRFADGGNTFFGLPARRIGVQPAPQALMEASKRRSGAQPTG